MVSLHLRWSKIFTQRCGGDTIQIGLNCHPSNHIMREDYIANYISEVILLRYLALKTVSLTRVFMYVLHKLPLKTGDGKNAFKQYVIANTYFVDALLGLITPQMCFAQFC